MTDHFNSEIERLYRDITNMAVDEIRVNKPDTYIDDSGILTQIMYNLAHIADELRALRRDCEIVEWVDSNQEDDEQETEDEKESESTEDESEDKKEICFICGKKLNIKDASGVIHNGDETYCCCQKCSGKFDALIDHFIMPTSMFF